MSENYRLKKIRLVGGPNDGESLFLSRGSRRFGQLIDGRMVAIYRRAPARHPRGERQFKYCGNLPDRP